MKIRLQLICLLLALTPPTISHAKIYRYITPEGSLLLTNYPKGKGYTRLVKTPKGWEPQKTISYRGDNKRTLSPHIRKAAETHKLPYDLLHAVIHAESAYNTDAISKAGAQGLMQLMPATAARFGVSDPFNPIDNINGGSRYLRYLLTLFKNDYELALAAYNAGENAVIRHGRKIPPYKETQHYVRKVLKLYHSNKAS